ncbi:MAG: nucleoside/nucleotide kinase family protein [Candidatus Nephthysia bennettiae]|uniref:Nucleoside/nucleotide kinase family protein n=1 Tax=Candidatus Nephthysia bennettiae TaxID=3127016 RepID=A0A934K2G8_9BACT|nr:nucleoside/nucleotide kinase family protein [Candidatus Dormibacteraeota bacterium]MBJ7613133.1 nucleoside/nucleotide kinase family protein [Candidatus Dormibacteraeota bacterium]PZR86899.1 MAG: nucleoside/nucleotide kinase family protein [Candidatus Dormibacteraeota bacterium]
MAGPPAVSYDEALARARALASAGGRRLLGLTGMPGAGKSTVAARLVEDLGGMAVLVPMDGFHLANAELVRLGRRDRKGSPDTFDSAGYVALLRRLREPEAGVTVYAPMFTRDLEEPVAGAIPVAAEVPLVVTDGNYLLVSEGQWSEVGRLLDEAWYVEADDSLRLSRLVARHAAFGKSPAVALSWATGSDQANAEVVRRTRDRADLIVLWG